MGKWVRGGLRPPHPLAEGATGDSPPLHCPHSLSALTSDAWGCGCGPQPGMRVVGGAGIVLPAEAG